jgi:Glu-tRNA(Gln) amidotransferase subunit E-like FAD-binding protein
MRDIDVHRDSIKETVESMAVDYGLDKKVINKLAKTMYKSNYGSLQEENNHFAMLYEILVEGKLRMEGDGEVVDPLDAELDAEIAKAA